VTAALTAGWRAYVLIAAVTLAACLPGLFSIPVLDRDEARFAQASAQMLESGDFVRIRLQEEPRNKKPIGAYWAQAASVALVSNAEAREIWAYRLPSVLGAILAACATFWGGAVLVGRRAALGAALLLGASLLLSTEGMIAKTDALLCGFTTLAMAALARLRTGDGARTPIYMPLIFWAALACGVLVKGPITPLVVGLACAALVLWERRADWLKPLLRWQGPALAAAISAPWAIAMLLDSGGAFFLQSFGGDIAPKLIGGDDHRGVPPGAHLLLLPFLIFPAALGLIPAFRDGWRALRAPRADETHAPVRFLVAWAAPIWLLFEIASTKLAHYTLPAYPAIALLAATGALRWFEAGGWKRHALTATLAIAGLGAVAVCAYVATLAPGDAASAFRRAVQAGIVAGGLLAMGVTAFALARRPEVALAAALATALMLTFTARERIAPEARTQFLTREVMQTIAREGLTIDAQSPLLSVGYREPSLVFSAGTHTILRQGAEAGQLAHPGQTALVDARERQAFEDALAIRGYAFTPFGDAVRGHNYSNGEDVLLQTGRVSVLEETRG
jgi:4-amino-4-deoxy-L-arabinose transferase-like glycosyltransferase